jgi:hypothetical protein
MGSFHWGVASSSKPSDYVFEISNPTIPMTIFLNFHELLLMTNLRWDGRSLVIPRLSIKLNLGGPDTITARQQLSDKKTVMAEWWDTYWTLIKWGVLR